MKIKLLEDYSKGLCGIEGATKDKFYTANEFIETFGIGVYDVIRDEFCDACEEERKSGVEIWNCGLRVFAWED